MDTAIETLRGRVREQITQSINTVNEPREMIPIEAARERLEFINTFLSRHPELIEYLHRSGKRVILVRDYLLFVPLQMVFFVRSDGLCRYSEIVYDMEITGEDSYPVSYEYLRRVWDGNVDRQNITRLAQLTHRRVLTTMLRSL